MGHLEVTYTTNPRRYRVYAPGCSPIVCEDLADVAEALRGRGVGDKLAILDVLCNVAEQSGVCSEVFDSDKD